MGHWRRAVQNATWSNIGPDKIAPVAKRANLAGRDYYEANRG